jgi:hypothetical protein
VSGGQEVTLTGDIFIARTTQQSQVNIFNSRRAWHAMPLQLYTRLFLWSMALSFAELLTG